jgi:hypothetical protein
MCLNETYKYRNVCIGEHLSDTFLIHNGLKQWNDLLCFSFLLGQTFGWSPNIRSNWN